MRLVGDQAFHSTSDVSRPIFPHFGRGLYVVLSVYVICNEASETWVYSELREDVPGSLLAEDMDDEVEYERAVDCHIVKGFSRKRSIRFTSSSFLN